MSRYYEKDGKKYATVTTIISDCTNSSGALTQWASNMCKLWIQENCPKPPRGYYSSGDDYCVSEEDLDEMRFNFRKVSQKALDIGSEVHKFIEMHLLSKMKRPNCLASAVMFDFLEKAKPEVVNAFNAFIDWEKEHELKTIALEQTVYGDRWAGTLDMICYLDDVKTVVDFKTSKDFYWDSMGPQIAAYKSVTDAERCGILRLDKESGLPFYRDRTKYYERDLEIFEHMVEIYMLRHPVIAKKLRGE